LVHLASRLLTGAEKLQVQHKDSSDPIRLLKLAKVLVLKSQIYERQPLGTFAD
jgi:hypothetical protein